MHLNVYLTYKGLLTCICNLRAQLSPSKNDFTLRVGKNNSENSVCSYSFLVNLEEGVVSVHPVLVLFNLLSRQTVMVLLKNKTC